MTDDGRASGRESTRARILATALGLFGELGFEATTMRAIADACHVTERTVYRYFPFKEDLLFAEVREAIPLLGELIAARPLDERTFTAVWHALKALERARPSVMGLLVRDMGERLMDKSSHAMERVGEEFCASIASGLLVRMRAAAAPVGAAAERELAFRAEVLARAALAPLITAFKASVGVPVEERSAERFDALLDAAYGAIGDG